MNAGPSGESLTVAPLRTVRGSIVLPGSKSISIRALLLAALAQGATRLTGVLESDDTAVMRGALAACGVPIRNPAPGVFEISGAAQLPRREADIQLGNSGLSARSLLAVLAFTGSRYRMSGVARMHERPISDLVDALRPLGAQIHYLGKSGYFPLFVEPAQLGHSRRLSVRGDASSQFLTGILQAAPLMSAGGPVSIMVEGPLISRPYVALTIDLMAHFGVDIAGDPGAPEPVFEVPQDSHYRAPEEFAVEGDASSASYFLALGALAGGPVRVMGIGRTSKQADVRFAEVLDQMGATLSYGPDWIEAASPGMASGYRLRPIDADFNHMPDAAMTVAMLAMFANGPSTLRNIGSWRVKETDRIAAMAVELAKLGAHVTAGADFLRIDPPKRINPATIDTYDDHRMAMSFALAACGEVAVEINDPGCVAKTFPEFFVELARLANPGHEAT